MAVASCVFHSVPSAALGRIHLDQALGINGNPAIIIDLIVAICRAFGIRIRKDDVVNEDGRIELAKPEYVSVAKPPKTGYCRDCASEVEIDDDYRCPKCGWPL